MTARQARWVRARRLAATALLAALLPAMVTCYGKFPLTKAVYKINGAMPSDTLETVVFWAFLIVPVYETAMVVDALVPNLIEFWTGLDADIASCEQDGRAYVFEPLNGGREAVITVSERAGPRPVLRLAWASPERCEVRDAEGRLLGAVCRDTGGGLVLADADGGAVGVLTAGELAMLRGALRAAP